MNDQVIRFRIGVFFLGTMILFGVLILLFGGFPNYFRSTDRYTITFSNAQGLGTGTPVRRSGVKIGEVRSLVLENETGKVRVEVDIRTEYKVRKGDRPTVVAGILGSDSAIEFQPPEDVKGVEVAFIEPGSTIEGAARTDTGALIQKTSDLMPPVQEALIEIKKVLQRFDKQLAPVFEDTLREIKELAKTSNQFVPELNKTNQDIRDLIKSTHQTIPDLKKTNDEVQLTARNWGKVGERLDVLIQANEDKLVKSLDRLQETLKRINQVMSDENQKYLTDILKNAKSGSERLDSIALHTEDLLKEGKSTLKKIGESVKNTEEILQNIQKMTQPLGQRSEAILKNVDEGAEKFNRLLGDVREIVQNIGRGEGTIQKLLTEPDLYNRLNESAYALNRIMPRLERIIRDVEIFADKIARHPESLGIGGVIRPGTGLKEPPSSVMPWRIPNY